MTDDVSVTFHVCKLCSDSVSFIQYGLVKHEHCGLLPHFSVIQNLTLVTLKVNTWFGKLKFFNFKQGIEMIPYEVVFLLE